MENEPEDESRPPIPTESSASEGAGGPVAPLERPIQEHLGKQLRSTYNVLTEKPAFLGDPAVPSQFDGLIQKLEARDRQRTEAIHDRAVAAVEGALQEALGAGPEPDDQPS